MENEKGFTKENTKKLLKWEGPKEIIWIIIFLCILVAAYGYYNDLQSYRNILNDPCIHPVYIQCSVLKAQEILEKKYPGAGVHCYNQSDTIECKMNGVDINMMPNKNDIQQGIQQANNISIK